MSPNETLFLESTSKIVKNGGLCCTLFVRWFALTCYVRGCACARATDIANSSFVQLQIWDFPGQLDFTDDAFDTEQIFAQCGALIYVIDAQV